MKRVVNSEVLSAGHAEVISENTRMNFSHRGTELDVMCLCAAFKPLEIKGLR